MLLIDPVNGQIVDANSAAENFYGYPLAALRQMTIQDINRLGAVEVAAERAKAQQEKRNYFIFPHKLANGSIRTVEVYSSPVVDADGRTLLFSIVHDISGKPVAENELAQYRTQLEELVDLRTNQVVATEARARHWLTAGLALQAVLIALLAWVGWRRHGLVVSLRHEAVLRERAESKLEKAQADLRRFAEIAAHHLREPTRHLMIFSQKLRKRLGRAADEDMELSLSTVESQAAYLHALVRDIQVYLAADTPLARPEDSDPTDIARKVVAGLGAELAESGGSVLVGNLPSLPIDGVRLKYLLEALLDNAIRYRHPDRPPLVRVEGKVDGLRTVLTVTDNGKGVPGEYKTRVLGVFEHLGHRERGQGTGLGLAVARRIVESCDGTIGLDDVEGGGTRVVMEFVRESLHG